MAVVSIVMPVYNGEKYLKQSITSVINQTFKDWNLIIVDDCSTDSSPKIMNEYAKSDNRIQVIHNKVNSKIPASLNNGFEKASGRYYTWTSDDNIYEHDAIEKMVNYLDEHIDIGLVYSNMRFIDEEGSETGIYESKPEDIFSNNCVGACFMYRSDIAKEAGKYSADWFLVEDYEYWLRIRNISKIGHIDELLYKYRRHEKSLSETRMIQVREKLYDLRLNMIQKMNDKIPDRIKTELFKEMWLQNSERHGELLDVFWNGEMPVDLHWLRRKGIVDMSKKVVLFGAGVFGTKALNYLGEEKVYCYVDNNPDLKGKIVNGKIVKSFDEMQELAKIYQIVIAVDAHKASILAEQLEKAGIKEYITYLEMVNNYKKPELSGQVDWKNTTERAKNWIINNSIKGEGIINNSQYYKSYPEVTGYYIPTLLRWGFRGLAVTYADWLCSIQHEDGAWYDTEDKEPYVFDTAQILKGLVAIYSIKPEVKDCIIKGCDWLLGQITDEGRLVTPSKAAWGNDGVCSELIHLYCLSPLIDVSKLLGKPEYAKAAKKVANYYITNYRNEILNFGFLSHFYSYVMEALCDIGETELAKEAMDKLSIMIDEKGYIPAFNDVDWVCSTGMFQLAITWYKLGDIERGNKALTYAAKLQNETGGWFGSYAVIDNPKPTDKKEYPDYIPVGEISWAVKYYLDAVFYKNRLEFDMQADGFSSYISKEDGRYQIILKEINSVPRVDKKIIDVGCGKGRFLKNLSEDVKNSQLYAVDISDKVMGELPDEIVKKNGVLTQIPYDDNTFDITYAVESLEHAIFPENAIEEMLRVTKAGGKVIVVDKSVKALGMLEIDAWEQWFDDEIFKNAIENTKSSLKIIDKIAYDSYEADGLFRAWVITK